MPAPRTDPVAGGATCSGCNCPEPTEEQLLARFDEVLAGYVGQPGALIPVLQIAQRMFGYLPGAALKRIATALDKPYSEVAGVVGFYSYFSTVPRGKHLVQVCLGTACYVRGGKEVLEGLKESLGIEVGETTADRRFSLDVGRCFGACGLAPVIMIDNDVHQRVRPTQLGRILDEYRDGPSSRAAAAPSGANGVDSSDDNDTTSPDQPTPAGADRQVGRCSPRVGGAS